LDEVGCSLPCPICLTIGKETQYPMYKRLGGPQGQPGLVQKISLPPGFDPSTIQPVGRCYTNCAVMKPSVVFIEA